MKLLQGCGFSTAQEADISYQCDDDQPPPPKKKPQHGKSSHDHQLSQSCSLSALKEIMIKKPKQKEI